MVAETGWTTGGVRQMLRLEGLALLLACLFAFERIGGDWRLFALLFLAPDVSFLGYLAGPRLGALAYNAAHAMLGPLALGFAALVLGNAAAAALALIWLAHIGFDRALGYGLKYTRGFGFTHLGRFGRKAKES